MNKKPVVWGAMGIIAVVVIVVALNSPYPPKDEISGAVGAAKQYRSDQIQDSDVVLQDPEIQDLLQSDFFHKLATDPEFRQVAVDQLARLDIADGRSGQFMNPASLSDLDSFLGLAVANPELRTALAEGRMDIVNRILLAENKAQYQDVANRVYLAQGGDAKLDAAAIADMKSFLDQVMGNGELRTALADGRVDMVNRILAADGKTALADAAGRVLLAVSRTQLSGRTWAAAELRVFLELARTNVELKTALAEGRLDMVQRILAAEGRTNLADAANRVYVSLGRTPELNAAALDDMRSFLDLAAGNGELKAAMADGRLEIVNRILAADGKTQLSEAAGRVFAAEGRAAQPASPTGLADLKTVLDLSKTNMELRVALAEGRLDIVQRALMADGRANLLDAAHRVFLALGRSPERNAAALDAMRTFMEYAVGRAELKTALADGRLDVVNRTLAADGKVALADAAARMLLAANRVAIEGRAFQTADMRVVLELAKVNVELRTALAEGRLDIVQRVLAAEGRTNLADAANRVYLSLGRSPELNAAALEDMRTFLDAAGGNAELRSALADGRLDMVNRILVAEGRTDLAAAAGRVWLAADASGRVAAASAAGDLRAVAGYAAENADFRQALQDGRLDAAAKVALAAGRVDVSLRSLMAARFVVGDSRSFVTDLNRLVAVADSPNFKQVADVPAWGRLLATTDAASWKSTVAAAGEGRVFAQE